MNVSLSTALAAFHKCWYAIFYDMSYSLYLLWPKELFISVLFNFQICGAFPGFLFLYILSLELKNTFCVVLILLKCIENCFVAKHMVRPGDCYMSACSHQAEWAKSPPLRLTCECHNTDRPEAREQGSGT